MDIRTSKEILIAIKGLKKLSEAQKFYAARILHDISFTMIYKKEEFVSKHSDYFYRICGSNHEYTKPVINELVKNGFLEIDHSYSVDRYSKGYKANINQGCPWITIKATEYLKDRQLKQYLNRTSRVLEKSAQWHSRNLKKLVEFDYSKLSEIIKEYFGINIEADKKKILKGMMEIDLKGYEEGLKKKLQLIRIKIIQLIKMDKYENITIVGANGGRHYTILSNTPKVLRNCLQSKSELLKYLFEIDIKNSQPILLLGICKKKGLDIEMELSEAILGGKFYETIGKLWGYDESVISSDEGVRSTIKKLTYSNILFADNRIRINSKYFQFVAAEYPKLSGTIISMTSTGVTLASLLQSAEADLMLAITKKLQAIGIHDSIIYSKDNTVMNAYYLMLAITKKLQAIGIHDSIIFAIDNQVGSEKVKRIIEEAFLEQYRICPQLDVRLISMRG